MVAFRIALRFLGSRKSQTVLIVLGLAIAISVQIFVGILISSLQVGLVDAVTGDSPHVTITPVNESAGIPGWQSVAAEVSNVRGVTGVTASAFSYTLLSCDGKNVSSGIRGLDLGTANAMYGISDSIVEGGMPGPNGILVGSVLNEELGAIVNGTLDVVMWNGTVLTMDVTGIFDSGNAFADNRAIVSLATCQEIFGTGDVADAIEVQVSDVFAADKTQQDIAAALDTSLAASNWKDSNADLLSALQSQSLSSYMIQAFVLVSVVIAIASVLAITVLQKSRQIGILKAMGIKDRDASLIFLYQGLLLGLLGAAGGIAIGLFLLYGFIFGTSAGGGQPVIDLIIDFRFIALSGCIAVASAMIASVLPARRSSKLSPVEVIRNA